MTAPCSTRCCKHGPHSCCAQTSPPKTWDQHTICSLCLLQIINHSLSLHWCCRRYCSHHIISRAGAHIVLQYMLTSSFESSWTWMCLMRWEVLWVIINKCINHFEQDFEVMTFTTILVHTWGFKCHWMGVDNRQDGENMSNVNCCARRWRIFCQHNDRAKT